MSVASQPKGELFATGSPDGKLRLIDAATGDVGREVSQGDAPARGASFHPNGDVIANATIINPSGKKRFTKTGTKECQEAVMKLLSAAQHDKSVEPIHTAALNGAESIVAYLIEAGANKKVGTFI